MTNSKEKTVGYMARYLFPHARTFREKVEQCLNDDAYADAFESWQAQINEVRQEIHAHATQYEPPTLAVKIERAKEKLAALQEREASQPGSPHSDDHDRATPPKDASMAQYTDAYYDEVNGRWHYR